MVNGRINMSCVPYHRYKVYIATIGSVYLAYRLPFFFLPDPLCKHGK